jgi:hypothetical protein
MKKMTCVFCVFLSALAFGGCANGYGYPPYYGHQRALAGTAMGAAGGALLGGAMTQNSDGAVIGGLLGGAAGGLVGNSMDMNQRPQPYYRGR